MARKRNTETWEVFTLDVWGNAKDGYDVNDVYRAGTTELPLPSGRNHREFVADLVRALRKSGHIDKPLRHKYLDVYDGDGHIDLSYKGKPQLQLRRKD